MYQFEWPKTDKIEQTSRKVQLFCEKYYPNGYTELDLETLIQLGYQTGQYSGLAAQFLEASGASEILDLKYWQYYYDMLMNNFDFKNYIKTLEPGCGYLPCLGSMIVKENPWIEFTGMDPNIIESWSNEHGIIPKKEPIIFDESLFRFKETTPVHEYDFLMGIHPCNATIPMIKLALQNEKEMFLAVCDCNGLAGIINAGYDDWVRYLVDLINAKLPRSMHVKIFLDYGYRRDNYKIDTIETGRPVICIHKKRVHQIPKILNNQN